MAAPAGVFSPVDYVLFFIVIAASTMIGIYFGFFSKNKQDNKNEYLVGSRNMAFFPIVMSLIASMTSGVTLLGVPTEIYTYGTQYVMHIFTEVLVCVVTAWLFVPVYYNLQVATTYEYLEMRYGKTVKYVLSGIYCITINLYTPFVIYAPALALNQVTGINIYLITTTTACICIFYTCVGGFRAVVWADTLQTFAMISAVIVVVIIGTIEVGGVGEVLHRANASGRLVFFNMDTSPFAYYTFWNVMAGGFFGWLAGMASNQPNLQRCLALPTLKKAQRATVLTSFGSATFVLFSVYTGITLFAKYQDCDPFVSKQVSKMDQILPFFIAEVGASVPGIAGIFVAGVFSAALSTLSTVLNSVSCVFLNDIVNPLMKEPLSEKQASWVLKGTVLVAGFLSIGLVFVLSHMGTIFQVTRIFGGISVGARLGIYLFGVLVPWFNSKSVIAGGITSSLFMLVIVIGNGRALSSKDLVFPRMPISVEGCDASLTASLNVSYIYEPQFTQGVNNDVFWLFRIAYRNNVLISLSVMLLATCVASLAFGFNDPRLMNHELFSPCVRPFLPASTLPKNKRQQLPKQQQNDEPVELPTESDVRPPADEAADKPSGFQRTLPETSV